MGRNNNQKQQIFPGIRFAIGMDVSMGRVKNNNNNNKKKEQHAIADVKP
jgi:hypothetical protein